MRLRLLALVVATAMPASPDFRPTVMIEPITCSDPALYASLVAEANHALRTRFEIPLFLRTYVTTSVTGQSRAGFNLSPSASLAGLMANRATFARDPSLAALRDRINAIVTPGPATYLKALRFDGTHTPGWLCNRFLRTDDEAGLLERVAALKTLLAAVPSGPPLINVFRVFAGSGPETHLVSINASSGPHLAALLDHLCAHPDPLATPAITRVSTLLYEELSP